MRLKIAVDKIPNARHTLYQAGRILTIQFSAKAAIAAHLVFRASRGSAEGRQKPLKRLTITSHSHHTPLKQGVNDNEEAPWKILDVHQQFSG